MLIRVTSDRFCAGVLLDENYNVVRCAPIIRKWLKGGIRTAIRAWQKHGWKIEVV